jgi:cysteine desulfurase
VQYIIMNRNDKRQVYLDHAATTKIDERVLKIMEPYLTDFFGNPSSMYKYGRQAKKGVNEARALVANVLGVKPSEIVFTGSGTESDNLAIFGIARAYKEQGKHIIVSKIEHKAVLEPVSQLEKEGFSVSYLEVDSNGLVDPIELKKLYVQTQFLFQ